MGGRRDSAWGWEGIAGGKVKLSPRKRVSNVQQALRAEEESPRPHSWCRDGVPWVGWWGKGAAVHPTPHARGVSEPGARGQWLRVHTHKLGRAHTQAREDSAAIVQAHTDRSPGQSNL